MSFCRSTTALAAAAVAAWLLTACSSPPAPTAGLPSPTAQVAQPSATSAVAAPAALPPPARPADAPAPTAAPTATRSAASAAPADTPLAADEAPTPAPTLGQLLATHFAAAPTAAGEVILVTGQVLDLAGNPVPGAAVEFWQTDANGVYDHPGDRGTAGRDRGFQFYGTSIADADGRYLFRTVQPGYYEPRPRHIHVKVKRDGRTLLTTQFYFREDQASLSGEGVFAQAGSLGDLLLLDELDRVEMGGKLVAVLAKDLVVNAGAPGSLTATPAQAEGPYYPVVPVANFDNDLAAVP